MSNAQYFYPNGNPSLEDDIPCGPGSAVGYRPLNWACLANGLCYIQNENYYGIPARIRAGAPDVLTVALTVRTTNSLEYTNIRG